MIQRRTVNIYTLRTNCGDSSPTQSLSKWGLANSQSLSLLLEELLEEYRLHHRNIVSQFPRLSFELEALLHHKRYSNVDVHCTRSPKQVSDCPLWCFVTWYEDWRSST